MSAAEPDSVRATCRLATAPEVVFEAWVNPALLDAGWRQLQRPTPEPVSASALKCRNQKARMWSRANIENFFPGIASGRRLSLNQETLLTNDSTNSLATSSSVMGPMRDKGPFLLKDVT